MRNCLPKHIWAPLALGSSGPRAAEDPSDTNR